MSPFCGATDTSGLDSWWHLPWVTKPVWISHLHSLSHACNGFIRFTSGVSPADILAVNVAAKSFPSRYLHTYASIGGTWTLDQRYHCTVNDRCATKWAMPAQHIYIVLWFCYFSFKLLLNGFTPCYQDIEPEYISL